MTMPFCDLKSAYEAYKNEFDTAWRRVMSSGWYILGPECKAFEDEFGAFCAGRHCVGVGNGTDAVELALRGAGVQAGDKVATVSHTAVATVAAIERLGAEPVFTDIDAGRFTMAPESLARVLDTFDIKAVLPVHLYGQCADMDQILSLAREHGCVLVEDCAQAHGAKLNGQRAGTFGETAAFSFYPTKNLGAFGDGGAVLCKDTKAAQHVKALRQYGWEQRYISDIAGFNSRLDELQAAFLRVRLKYLDKENTRRKELANAYLCELSSVEGLEMPIVAENSEPVWHLYVIRADSSKRDQIIENLKELGIPTAIHYPVPVHQQPAYAGRIKADPLGLSVTEKVCRQIISLPLYPGMSEKDLLKIAEGIRTVMERT